MEDDEVELKCCMMHDQVSCDGFSIAAHLSPPNDGDTQYTLLYQRRHLPNDEMHQSNRSIIALDTYFSRALSPKPRILTSFGPSLLGTSTTSFDSDSTIVFPYAFAIRFPAASPDHYKE